MGEEVLVDVEPSLIESRLRASRCCIWMAALTRASQMPDLSERLNNGRA